MSESLTNEYLEVDEVAAILGNPGRFQIIQFILLSSTYIPMSMNDFVVIFFGLSPTGFGCYDEFHNRDPRNLMELNARSLNYSSWNVTSLVCDCPHGYYYSYPGRQWSIVGEMDLVCDRSSLVDVASAIYFLGQAVTSPISGWASDRFGRRKTLLTSYGVYAVVQVGLVFSRDYISFVILRFGVGASRQVMNSAFFVLMMEWIPPSRRETWGTLSEYQYNVGLLVVTLVAYLLQNWIHIQIFIAASCICAVPLYWFAPESLSWLYLKGRGDEFVQTCRFVARFNGIRLPDQTMTKIENFATQRNVHSSGHSAHTATFIDCFRTPAIRKTTLLCLVCWFASCFGFLGMSYLSSAVATDVYLDLAINGLLAFIPTVFVALVASKYGNRRPLASYFLTASLFALIAGAIPGTTDAQLTVISVMSVISRMAFVATMCVLFMYTTELFPTGIRGNAYSLCSTVLNIGCMITPLLPLMARGLPFKGSGFVFVASVSLFATTAATFLRETHGQPLPRTIEEVEQLEIKRASRPSDGKSVPALRRDSTLTLIPQVEVTNDTPQNDV